MSIWLPKWKVNDSSTPDYAFYTTPDHGLSVMIGPSGVIEIYKDDWLSKYSLAIHGDLEVEDRYVRPRGDGSYLLIENLDLIIEGEQLLHLPTYLHFYKWYQMQFMEDSIPGDNFSPPPVEVKDQNFLEKVESFAGIKAKGVFKIVAKLAWKGTMSITSAGVNMLKGLITATVQFINAHEIDISVERFYATAYAMTAWVFDDLHWEESKLLGRVEQTFPDRIVVNGLSVNTKFADMQVPANPNDLLLVRGALQMDGTILASEVTLPDGSLLSGESSLVGTLGVLEPGTLRMQNIRFDISSAQIHAGVVAGDRVRIRSARLNANTVELLSDPIALPSVDQPDAPHIEFGVPEKVANPNVWRAKSSVIHSSNPAREIRIRSEAWENQTDFILAQLEEKLRLMRSSPTSDDFRGPKFTRNIFRQELRTIVIPEDHADPELAGRTYELNRREYFRECIDSLHLALQDAGKETEKRLITSRRHEFNVPIKSSSSSIA